MRRILLVLALLGCGTERDPVASNVPCDADGLDAEVVRLANEARAAEGLGALSCDGLMSRAARGHSEDMCERDYFDHVSPEGVQPWDRMRAEGAQFNAAAENIAQGYLLAAEVHQGWMNSDGHRANLLNADYGRIGVGHAPCNGKYYWTQVFAD